MSSGVTSKFRFVVIAKQSCSKIEPKRNEIFDLPMVAMLYSFLKNDPNKGRIKANKKHIETIAIGTTIEHCSGNGIIATIPINTDNQLSQKEYLWHAYLKWFI